MQFIQHPVPDELRGLFGRRHIDDPLGNLAPREEVYPDQGAPIVRREGETIVLQNARWGPPRQKRHHSASGIDHGVTNIRNTTAPCSGRPKIFFPEEGN